MANKPSDKTNLIPWVNPQNPSPVGYESQNEKFCVQEQVDRILQVFYDLVPSNYVSQVQGPWYTRQFQAAAEQIAKIQCEAQETLADEMWEYTRPEFLHQILGLLVFPDSGLDGIPEIKGDLSYRDFLRAMAILLLKGSTKPTVQDGLSLLTSATVTLLEKGIEARKLGDTCAWGIEDQWTFEVNAEGDVTAVDRSGVGLPGSGTVDLGRFPDDPFVLLKNVGYVLKALRPAHTLYDFRFLFRDTFGDLFSDESSFTLDSYYYGDFRKYCLGRKEVTGTGDTLIDRSLFSDSDRDFSSILPGAELVILTGPNSTAASSTDAGWVGRYRVASVLSFPISNDSTPRPYTTSPSGLSGYATVSGDEVTDTSQDWSLAEEGEQLTFSSGPNEGTYRLKTLVGSGGGPLGDALGPATIVRVAPSLLRLQYFMPHVATGQDYTVTVDRLGIQEPHMVTGEDASVFFTP